MSFMRNMLSSIIFSFVLHVTDVPRQPTNVRINSITKQITWAKVAGYDCLPESHFVVEYKKSQSGIWMTAARYFENRRFDLNASKGEMYDVRIYAENFIGRSLSSKVVTFRTNSKFKEGIAIRQKSELL